MKRILLLILISLAAAVLVPCARAEKSPKQLAELGPLASADDSALAKIAPDLLKQLLTQSERNASGNEGSTTFLVYMADRADLASAAASASADLRKHGVVEALQETARVSQAPLIEIIERQEMAGHVTRHASYWVFNGMAIDGDLDAALALAALPDVASIRTNRVHQLEPQPEAVTTSFDSDLWSLVKINAPQVWQTFGITGEGVVVANMDSGVDWTHPALQQAYRGYDADSPANTRHDYNWFDPTGTYPSAPGPNEAYAGSESDHGTHTMGSIVGAEPDGSQTYGVAPGAKWIATKAFTDDGGSTDEWIHACFQWILAPTDLAGQKPDPSRAPDILSCSWGNDDGSDVEFSRDVAALRAAGILSVWAGGNEGPGERTINAPGCVPGELAVGATTSSDDAAYFSSRGPSPYGEIKPDVSAPGVAIVSTIAGGGTSSWQGTSMATPHVAGLAALVTQAAAHSLSVTDTQFVITSTVVDLGTPGKDNTFGWGRIDALAAVEFLVASGTISGTVRDAGDGQPIQGAQVSALNDLGVAIGSATTDSTGHYALRVPEGQVDVRASAFGYAPTTVQDIAVPAGAGVATDLALARLPYGTLVLSVRRASDGAPAAGTASLAGLGRERAIGASGQLNWELPEGTYDLEIQPPSVGLRGAQVDEVAILDGQTTQVEVELAAAPNILFVHGDAWYGQDTLSYYGASLDALLYGYDVFETSTRYDVPSASTLASYDVVIWSNSDSSPGYMGGWDELATYLDNGGALLLSGQDIGYWDDDGATSFYARYLHAQLTTDTAQEGGLSISPGTPWEGIDLTINHTVSAQNQVSPDGILNTDSMAQVMATYPDGNGAALAIDACSYRAIYAGFGLEGAGPPDQRTAALDQAILWLDKSPTSGRLIALLSPEYGVAGPGASSTAKIALTNRAATTQGMTVLVDSPWPAMVHDSSGSPIQRLEDLGACASMELSLVIDVPLSANIGDEAVAIITLVPDDQALEHVIVTATVLVQQSWQVVPALLDPLHRAAAVADGCGIVVVGGSDGPSSRAEVWGVDIATGASYDISSLPAATSNCAAVMIGRELYVLGGYDVEGGFCLDTVQIYDLDGLAWRQGTQLPTALSGVAAAAIGSDIYVMGGNTGGTEALATGYVLDASGVWRTMAPMPGPADFGQAVTLDGRIYYAGGWPSLNSLWRYDPATDTWETLATMLQGRQSFVLATDGEYLYAAGGGQQWEGIDSVERYDPVSNRWIALPSLAESYRAGTCGAMVNGRLVVIGGTGDQRASTAEFLDVGAPLASSIMTASADQVRNGETLTYTLYLKNPSRQPANPGLRLFMSSYLGTPSMSLTECQYSGDPLKVVTWQGEIAAQDVLTITVSAPVNAGTAYGANLGTTAVITGMPCYDDFWIDSNIKLIEPSLHASTASVAPTTANPGDLLHYEIQVVNASPFAISGAEVVSKLPAQTNILTDSLVGGTYAPGDHAVRWQGDVAMSPSAAGFAWRDASGGQRIAHCDDCCSTALPLGFDFAFYGMPYSEIVVSSNGTVLFGGCDHSYSNGALPSSAMSHGMVAPFWDDLNPGGSGAVFFEVQGQAPNRVAVVSWENVPSYGSPDVQTFQVLLFEGSNGIICQYLDMNGDRGAGSSATVGIQSPDGTTGEQYLYNGQPSEHALGDEMILVLDQPSTLWGTNHTIAFDARVHDDPGADGELICRTSISDGLHVFDRPARTWLLGDYSAIKLPLLFK